MILNPRFYNYARVDRREERVKLGLDPDRATGLMLFGGQGNWKMLEIDRRLGRLRPAHSIDLYLRQKREARRRRCAPRNLRCRASLKGSPRIFPTTCNSRISLSASPARQHCRGMAMGLPVIVERNAWTLAAGALQHGVGSRKAGGPGGQQLQASRTDRGGDARTTNSFPIPPECRGDEKSRALRNPRDPPAYSRWTLGRRARCAGFGRFSADCRTAS